MAYACYIHMYVRSTRKYGSFNYSPEVFDHEMLSTLRTFVIRIRSGCYILSRAPLKNDLPNANASEQGSKLVAPTSKKCVRAGPGGCPVSWIHDSYNYDIISQTSRPRVME
jgi:hypothetical protein